MNYKLLGVNTEKEINIGDYIQAVAAEQFLPSLDGFIQREELNQYKGSETSMIMNGWFMHHPESWPLSEKINPLFIAFHINKKAEKEILSPKSIEYLKKYEPIGCRDKRTMELLKSKGVNAYFSGCLTLTLGEKYKSNVKDDSVYFVDVPFYLHSNRLKDYIYTLCFFKTAKGIASKYFEKSNPSLRQIKRGASFIRHYKKFFSLDILKRAIFIKHQVPTKNEEDLILLNRARDLIRKYSKASLVVTTRIHCALPCLGLETPVIYIDHQYGGELSECRMDGLRELFTSIKLENNRLINENDTFKKIFLNNPPVNKNNWEPLSKEIVKICSKWMKKNENTLANK